MKKPVWIGVGALLLVMGVIFGLQGLGVIAGSAMTNVTLWAVIGPVIAVIGIVLIAVGLRRSSTR